MRQRERLTRALLRMRASKVLDDSALYELLILVPSTTRVRVKDAKNAAHGMVFRAIRAGKLTRPTACERCYKAGRVYAHHADYSEPLFVVWFCPKCHKEEHARLERAERMDP